LWGADTLHRNRSFGKKRVRKEVTEKGNTRLDKQTSIRKLGGGALRRGKYKKPKRLGGGGKTKKKDDSGSWVEKDKDWSNYWEKPRTALKAGENGRSKQGPFKKGNVRHEQDEKMPFGKGA